MTSKHQNSNLAICTEIEITCDLLKAKRIVNLQSTNYNLTILYRALSKVSALVKA